MVMIPNGFGMLQGALAQLAQSEEAKHQRELQAEEAEANRKAARLQTIGTVAGAAVGFGAGGPAGMQAGAQLGRAASGLVPGSRMSGLDTATSAVGGAVALDALQTQNANTAAYDTLRQQRLVELQGQNVDYASRVAAQGEFGKVAPTPEEARRIDIMRSLQGTYGTDMAKMDPRLAALLLQAGPAQKMQQSIIRTGDTTTAIDIDPVTGKRTAVAHGEEGGSGKGTEAERLFSTWNATQAQRDIAAGKTPQQAEQLAQARKDAWIADKLSAARPTGNDPNTGIVQFGKPVDLPTIRKNAEAEVQKAAQAEAAAQASAQAPKPPLAAAANPTPLPPLPSSAQRPDPGPKAVDPAEKRTAAANLAVGKNLDTVFNNLETFGDTRLGNVGRQVGKWWGTDTQAIEVGKSLENISNDFLAAAVGSQSEGDAQRFKEMVGTLGTPMKEVVEAGRQVGRKIAIQQNAAFADAVTEGKNPSYAQKEAIVKFSAFEPIVVREKKLYDALPEGTWYIDSKGNKARKLANL